MAIPGVSRLGDIDDVQFCLWPDSVSKLGPGMGAGNFSLEFASLGSAIGLGFANFTFNWQTWKSGALAPSELNAVTEWWSGDIPHGTVTGPFTPPSYRSMINGVNHNNHLWSGFEWYVPGPGVSKQTLVNESAYTTINQFSAPTCLTPPCKVNVPAFTTIDPVGVAWTGLSTLPGYSTSNGTLLQTGYVYDQANPNGTYCTAVNKSCDYTFYFELSPNLAFAYSGNPAPRGSFNDTINEEVFAAKGSSCSAGGSMWITEIDDATQHHAWIKTRCIEFSPLYGKMIYDVPQLKVTGLYPWYQQTPKFGTVTFESGFVSTSTTVYSTATLYGPPGTFNAYNMVEKSGVPSTTESFAGGCHRYEPWVLPSCQFNQWSSSAYDYNWV